MLAARALTADDTQAARASTLRISNAAQKFLSGSANGTKCEAALLDYAAHIGETRNQLARLASSNYIVIAELVISAASDPSALGELYEALAYRHLDNYGDVTAGAFLAMIPRRASKGGRSIDARSRGGRERVPSRGRP